jgi:DNA polymerase-1
LERLVAKSVAESLNVVVVSGDKDFQQLVRSGVWLAQSRSWWIGWSRGTRVSSENGSERLGVPPEYVTDYLALVGDSSDNIPGVRGIGEKTACELVKEYGHLESILAHAAEIRRNDT